MSHNFLSAVQDTIGAGTSEVQREVIALRGLACRGVTLPKHNLSST